MSLVLSLVQCVQELHSTNSCCEHATQFNQAVHHFVAGVQEFELVRSSFRSTVVQTVSFLSERAKCTFDSGFVRVPGFFGRHVFANKRWLRPS